ncbi:MAG: hypothetical protein HY320_04650 [Armatimonadetes bacterium]|nr:hypothetical protein [Armatimonadota bacterium]
MSEHFHTPPVPGPPPEEGDAKYRDASYLGTDPEEREEVQDLGFIVEDHDDRRIHLTGGWQRVDLVDTDEPLETGRSAPIPGMEELEAQDPPQEWFATDYHVDHLQGEVQEEDFVETSMLDVDPHEQSGVEDYTDESDLDRNGIPNATDVIGHVQGIGYGFGTTLPQDIGPEGFEVADNPLVRPAPAQPFPVSQGPVSEPALGLRDVDEMGTDEDLDRLADLAAGEEEREAE